MNGYKSTGLIKDVHVRYWTDRNAAGKEVFSAILSVQLLDGRSQEISVESAQPIDTWEKVAVKEEEVVKKLVEPELKTNVEADGNPTAKKLGGLPKENTPAS